MVRSGALLIVVMPRVRTSLGSRGSACATRFCTSCCALSGSVPSRNVTLSVINPSVVAWLLKAASLGKGPEQLACLQAALTVNPGSAKLKKALEIATARAAAV